jgi:hypothetical protein
VHRLRRVQRLASKRRRRRKAVRLSQAGEVTRKGRKAKVLQARSYRRRMCLVVMCRRLSDRRPM